MYILLSAEHIPTTVLLLCVRDLMEIAHGEPEIKSVMRDWFDLVLSRYSFEEREKERKRKQKDMKNENEETKQKGGECNKSEKKEVVADLPLFFSDSDFRLPFIPTGKMYANYMIMRACAPTAPLPLFLSLCDRFSAPLSASDDNFEQQLLRGSFIENIGSEVEAVVLTSSDDGDDNYNKSTVNSLLKSIVPCLLGNMQLLPNPIDFVDKYSSGEEDEHVTNTFVTPLRKTTASILDDMSLHPVYGPQLVSATFSHVENRIGGIREEKNITWPEQEACLLALGAVSQGVTTDVLVSRAVNLITPFLSPPLSYVSSIASWSLSRYTEALLSRGGYKQHALVWMRTLQLISHYFQNPSAPPPACSSSPNLNHPSIEVIKNTLSSFATMSTDISSSHFISVVEENSDLLSLLCSALDSQPADDNDVAEVTFDALGCIADSCGAHLSSSEKACALYLTLLSDPERYFKGDVPLEVSTRLSIHHIHSTMHISIPVILIPLPLSAPSLTPPTTFLMPVDPHGEFSIESPFTSARF